MNIAVASGKGGTGKTTIATNLAYLVSHNVTNLQYLDCDVEEPNGHLFLKPELTKREKIALPVPEIDMSKCTSCGLCVKICQYKAITTIADKVLVFEELCHGCGGCKEVCPEKAISETGREIGVIEYGTAKKIKFIHGKLRIGEAMSPPLIKKVINMANEKAVNIIDVPPGTSCPVVMSIKNADFVVLVTEPAPFGLNDLELAIEMVKKLRLPFGVVVNRHEEGNFNARFFCMKRNVPILTEIPDDRKVAESYSEGKLVLEEMPGFGTYFNTLWDKII